MRNDSPPGNMVELDQNVFRTESPEFHEPDSFDVLDSILQKGKCFLHPFLSAIENYSQNVLVIGTF